MITKHPVELVSWDERSLSGQFLLWQDSPDDENRVRLELNFAGQAICADAETFFDALTQIRKRLELLGFRPKCLGACKDIYPSPMIRSMGTGEKAYRLRIGVPAKTRDLVSIFVT